MVRHWVIVARHDLALYQTLAGAFWNRKGYSVVLDRRTADPRRHARRTFGLPDRRKPPLDLATQRFCVVDAANPYG